MKKGTYHIIGLSILNLGFTVGSVSMYMKDKGLTTDLLAIALCLIFNIIFVNEIITILKNTYQLGIQRGRLEIQNTFKKEN